MITISRGEKHGKLTVIREAARRRDKAGTSRRWILCKCACGNVKEYLLTSLKSGNSKSCGCGRIKSITKHSMSNSPEFHAWANMLQRCENKNNARFSDYGGRGIAVCDRWRNSFEDFYADMGPKPSNDYSIDRINNDIGYSPNNCRWATRSQQQRNKRPTNNKNLKRGDEHWTRKQRVKARQIAIRNIKNAHGERERNSNSKMSQRTANLMRAAYSKGTNLTMAELGKMFGVGRETARKIIRGTAWQ